ncbi:MAG: glutathione S-transferase family protein, partial [Kofleriaceae bacterium]|nr:glutathione S-transferase family protein [Kofleriaceae bacterium]
DGPFVTGGELTIADLVVGDTYRQYKSGTMDGLSVDTLAPYPKIVRLGEAYLAHPGLVAYAAR